MSSTGNSKQMLQLLVAGDSDFGGNEPGDLKNSNIKAGFEWLFGADLQTPYMGEMNTELSHNIHAFISAGALIKGAGELWNPKLHGPQVSDGSRTISLSSDEVKQQLDELFSLCNSLINSNTAERHQQFRVAAFFLHRFLAIHPYCDGNGRTGRLLTSLLLMRLGAASAPLCFNLPTDGRRRYIDGLHAEPVTGLESEALLTLQELMQDAERLTMEQVWMTPRLSQKVKAESHAGIRALAAVLKKTKMLRAFHSCQKATMKGLRHLRTMA